MVAGNEVGITGARQCAVPLGSAHLCAGFICGNMEMPWWRGCGCFPGGQGVAGSNPAVPTGQRLVGATQRLGKSQSMSANDVTLGDIARLVGHSGTAVTERVYRYEIRPSLTQGAEVMDHLFR